MATSELIVDLTDRVDPNANGPGTTTSTSSGATTTNSFRLRIFTLDFDASTDEATSWQFRVPSNYSSGGTVIVSAHSGSTSGNVVFKTAVAAATSAVTTVSSLVYGAVDTFAATAVPSTGGQLFQTSQALSATSLAAGRLAWLMFGRDANNASDTCAGDVSVTDVTFSYTST